MKTQRAWRRLSVLILFLAAPSASCFSDRISGDDDNLHAELCAGPSENVVRIINFTFDPPSLTVAPGTRVTWVNCDETPHTATSSTNVFNTGLLDRHRTGSHTFGSEGSFDYFCQPHPNMVGTIVVES